VQNNLSPGLLWTFSHTILTKRMHEHELAALRLIGRFAEIIAWLAHSKYPQGLVFFRPVIPNESLLESEPHQL